MPADWTSQFRFYEAEAERARLAYVGITLTSGFIGIAIPIVIGYLDVPDIVPALLGASVAALALIDGVYQTRETWIRSRDAAEALRSEAILYRTHAGAYAKRKDPESYLGERVATISDSEVTAWRQKAVEDAAQ
jgi:hypothetical protein